MTTKGSWRSSQAGLPNYARTGPRGWTSPRDTEVEPCWRKRRPWCVPDGMTVDRRDSVPCDRRSPRLLSARLLSARLAQQVADPGHALDEILFRQRIGESEVPGSAERLAGNDSHLGFAQDEIGQFHRARGPFATDLRAE